LINCQCLIALHSCRWKEQTCDEAYIEEQFTDMGLCYTVNGNPEDIPNIVSTIFGYTAYHRHR